MRGTANTVRGFYEFQGRRFTIQRGGTLQFHGLPQINPDLNVTAERLIPNTGVTARIHITGAARAPQIALSSNPPLDEADILSLIVFNRSVNELGTGERASLAETAGGIASGFVASSLGRSIGKALDVDLFEITTSDVETGRDRGRRHPRQAGQRQGLRPLPPAVRPAQLHRVHAGIPAGEVLAGGNASLAGNERRRESPDPAPRGTRWAGSDFLLQLLISGLKAGAT